jgi:hypothetical protein
MHVWLRTNGRLCNSCVGEYGASTLVVCVRVQVLCPVTWLDCNHQWPCCVRIAGQANERGTNDVCPIWCVLLACLACLSWPSVLCVLHVLLVLMAVLYVVVCLACLGCLVCLACPVRLGCLACLLCLSCHVLPRRAQIHDPVGILRRELNRWIQHLEKNMLAHSTFSVGYLNTCCPP